MEGRELNIFQKFLNGVEKILSTPSPIVSLPPKKTDLFWVPPLHLQEQTMNNTEMVAALNSDLANEYKHWHFYMNSAVRIRGLHRPELREFLLEQAKQEMEHILEFSDIIVSLGGTPITMPSEFATNLTCPVGILKEALAMELEVLSNYLNRMDQADMLDDRVWGRRITIFLEEQMNDSGRDADELKQMIEMAKGGESTCQLKTS